MASIRKRGSHWQAQVRIAGQKGKSKTFRTKKEAVAWSIQTHQTLLELKDAHHSGDLTLADILLKYRDTVVISKLSNRVETSIITTALADVISTLEVSKINRTDVIAYRDRRLNSVSPATMAREFGVLRHAWRIANEEWGVVSDENPFKAVRLPRLNGPRERRLRHGELSKILTRAAKQPNPYIPHIIVFALETALRGKEILELTWDDVDLDACVIHVKKSKSGNERRVPLTATAARVLMHLPANSTNSVFPVKMSLLKQAWKRITEKAAIVDLHFHDLRHESISRFIDGGLTIPEVASISGHSDSRSLLRYAHPSPEKLREKFVNFEGLGRITSVELEKKAPNILSMQHYFRTLRSQPNRNQLDEEIRFQAENLCPKNESTPRKILNELAEPFLSDDETPEIFFNHINYLKKD